MDKRDKTMMDLLSSQINFYGEVLAQTNSLHAFAVMDDRDKLAAATLKAVDGLSELVGHFSLHQDAIMKRNGAVHIPIKSTKLVHEIIFKEIRSKRIW